MGKIVRATEVGWKRDHYVHSLVANVVCLPFCARASTLKSVYQSIFAKKNQLPSAAQRK